MTVVTQLTHLFMQNIVVTVFIIIVLILAPAIGVKMSQGGKDKKPKSGGFG